MKFLVAFLLCSEAGSVLTFEGTVFQMPSLMHHASCLLIRTYWADKIRLITYLCYVGIRYNGCDAFQYTAKGSFAVHPPLTR
jgi:hypothetical protein